MSIKIEAGRFYKTRDGRKVGPMELRGKNYWAHFLDGHYSWLASGYHFSLTQPCNFDLIAEWTDDEWGDWVDGDWIDANWNDLQFAKQHDIQAEHIDGKWRHRMRPRKPVVETVTLYWHHGKLPEYAAPFNRGPDTHTITLTRIDGVWQREAVLEEIK